MGSWPSSQDGSGPAWRPLWLWCRIAGEASGQPEVALVPQSFVRSQQTLPMALRGWAPPGVPLCTCAQLCTRPRASHCEVPLTQGHANPCWLEVLTAISKRGLMKMNQTNSLHPPSYGRQLRLRDVCDPKVPEVRQGRNQTPRVQAATLPSSFQQTPDWFCSFSVLLPLRQ